MKKTRSIQFHSAGRFRSKSATTLSLGGIRHWPCRTSPWNAVGLNEYLMHERIFNARQANNHMGGQSTFSTFLLSFIFGFYANLIDSLDIHIHSTHCSVTVPERGHNCIFVSFAYSIHCLFQEHNKYTPSILCPKLRI